MVPVNAVVQNIKDLEAVPIRVGSSPAVFVRDVASVEDGSDIVTCYALVNGRRTVYIPVTKRADASTLAVVDLVRANLNKFRAVLPSDVRVSYEFDQSPYVTRAIAGLTLEGTLGASHGDHGAPLPAGLAERLDRGRQHPPLPAGCGPCPMAHRPDHQPDDPRRPGPGSGRARRHVDGRRSRTSTPISRQNKPVARAVADSGGEVALPLLVAMLCVLAVFLPSFLMQGAARALFVPLSLAVGFSMIASYLLASSFVPVVCVWMMRAHRTEEIDTATRSRSGFERFRAALRPRSPSAPCLWRWLVVTGYLAAGDRSWCWRSAAVSGPRSFRRWKPASSNCACGPSRARAWIARRPLRCASSTSSKQETGPDGVALTLGLRRRSRPQLSHQLRVSVERRAGRGRAAGAAQGRGSGSTSSRSGCASGSLGRCPTFSSPSSRATSSAG